MTTPRQPAHGHLALLASAGSGKTTRLCQRYLQLLAGREPAVTPDRICALTFTRKAAGEIFDRIVALLCRGASCDGEAAGLAKDLGMPGLDRAEFARLLRLFLDHLHRAVIGTMDSFVVGVARAFPLELGIPADFRVADAADAEGRALRQDILAAILAAPEADGGSKEFLEAFKRATFGVEEKSLAYFLEQVVPVFHLAYRFCRDKARWGNEELIWPGTRRAPGRLLDRAELAAQAAAVGAWIAAERARPRGADPRFLNSLELLVAALAGYGLTASWDERFNSGLCGQLLGNRAALRRGETGIAYYGQTAAVAPEAAHALARLLDNLVAVELRRALEKTRGLHDLLDLYDRAYDAVARESGRFTFTDVQSLLAPGDGVRGGAALSREHQAGRLFIDYRMDSRLDHWLLDEFQDTSDLQWAIFSNLVSELVQGDPEGRARSFFYVGDIKQSIYRWRGGNPGLFLELRERYNRAGEVIQLKSLSKTWRCSQPVVDAVNRVFTGLPDGRLPAGTIEDWQSVWSPHETFNLGAQGHVALLEHPALEESGEEQEAEARYRLAAALLNEIQPARRGIEVGILARDNRACGELVNVLRGACPGIGFVHEGKAGIIGNELAQVLLSLVRLAAHPGDVFAWQHIRMSPMGRALAGEGIARERLAPRLLAEIEARGFRSFLGAWGARLERVFPLNAYGRECLERLEKAAAEFDAEGSRSCHRFLQFAADYEIHGKAARGLVRIMTVHQAKGLEFDLVILPQLQHRTRMNMARAETPEMLCGGKAFDPDWILRPPRRPIAEHDAVLSERLGKADEEHAFDWLCLLYVAMTRAKHALYLLVSPAKDSEAFRPAALLKLQLAGGIEPESAPRVTVGGQACRGLYANGPADWYRSFPEAPAAAPASGAGAAAGAGFAGRLSRRRVLKRSEPSKQEQIARRGSALFKAETTDVLDFGSAIHEVFESVAWLEPDAEAEALLGRWRPSRLYDGEVDRDVRAQFRRCLASPEVRAELARPAGDVALWREKSFEIILDGEWISGVFDRVVIARDAASRPVSAAILDFKSNRNLDTEARLRDVAAHYRPQMDLYRRALAAILGLAEARISAQLLFTVPARVIRLAGGRG